MRKRTTIPLLIVLLALAALGLMLYLRAKAPPEAARLLPESDAIVYINVKTIRSATHFDLIPVQRSGYFQHFIDATGVVPERDIDSVAFALHRMPNPSGPNGPVAYSEVFIGRFNGAKLASYLASIAGSQEAYAGRTIYSIPIDGRQLRVAQLGYDMIAASNTPTPEQIHSMLDRSRASALSTPGSSLLAARFHDVPILSEAWGIGHIGLPFSQSDEEPGSEANSQPGYITLLGFQLPLRGDTDLVASLRYTGARHMLSGGAVHLRIEEIAPDPAAAVRTVDALTTILNILRGIGAEQAQAQQPRTPADEAMHAVLNSISLTHHDDRALLNANASLEQLKALATAHDPASAEVAPEAGPLSAGASTVQSPRSTLVARDRRAH